MAAIVLTNAGWIPSRATSPADVRTSGRQVDGGVDAGGTESDDWCPVVFDVCVLGGLDAGDDDGEEFGAFDELGVDGAVVSSDGGGAGVSIVSEPEPEFDPDPFELLCDLCDVEQQLPDDEPPPLPLLPSDSSQLMGWSGSACWRSCHCASSNE